MSAAAYEIQGRTIEVPVQARDCDSWSASFLVRAGAAQALAGAAGLEAVQLLPRRALLMVAFTRYRESDLGPYEEVAITLLARRRDPADGPAAGGSRAAGRGELGIYVHRLAQSQSLAVEASRRIWGYPSFLADVQIAASDARAVCSLARAGRQVLTISLRPGGPLMLHDPNLPNYSLRDGVLRVSEWNQYGVARARLGGARLQLGSDPLADELRSLRVPGRAFMSASMPHIRAELGSCARRGAIAAAERPVTTARPRGDRPAPPRARRVRTRLEHQLDTRSVRLAAWLLHATRGRVARLWGRRALVLTTRGRRTGRARSVPLQYFPDGQSVIVVAANSGLDRPPAWYLNLAADPMARVEIDGRTIAVHARELPDDQADAFWPRLLELAPDYGRYPRRTSRRIPLVRLTPVTSAPQVMAGRGHGDAHGRGGIACRRDAGPRS